MAEDRKPFEDPGKTLNLLRLPEAEACCVTCDTEKTERISLIHPLHISLLIRLWDSMQAGQYVHSSFVTGELITPRQRFKNRATTLHFYKSQTVGVHGSAPALYHAVRSNRGNIDGGSRVGRNDRAQIKFTILAPPVADDFAMNGIIFRPRKGQVSNRLRPDDKMLEAGRGGVGIDAGERLVKPRRDLAKHNVIARGHSTPILP